MKPLGAKLSGLTEVRVQKETQSQCVALGAWEGMDRQDAKDAKGLEEPAGELDAVGILHGAGRLASPRLCFPNRVLNPMPLI